MSFVVIAVLIVLTALAVGYVGLLLEEHAEWREWHVPRARNSYPIHWNTGNMTAAPDGRGIRHLQGPARGALHRGEPEQGPDTGPQRPHPGVPERHRAQDRVPDDLDRDARGSPCANDPIIPAQGPERTARDTTRPDLVTADSLPDESIGEQPLPPCKNKPRAVRPRGSRIVSYSIAFGRPGLSSRVCAHARTASSE